jgi:hypothetical protein
VKKILKGYFNDSKDHLEKPLKNKQPPFLKTSFFNLNLKIKMKESNQDSKDLNRTVISVFISKYWKCLVLLEFAKCSMLGYPVY